MRGAEKIIRQHRPVVIYELDYRFGPQVNLTMPWMAAHGYDCAVPNPGKGPGKHCSVCNVLCMPETSMWNYTRPSRPKEKKDKEEKSKEKIDKEHRHERTKEHRHEKTEKEHRHHHRGKGRQLQDHQTEVICVGYRWAWYVTGGKGCASSPVQKHEASDARTVFVASLSYGGTDQITISTVHLARELNVLNMHGPGFVQVLPLARDLNSGDPKARTEALALFPDPHRPHVQLGQIFDVSATRKCSSARLLDGGIAAVTASYHERQVSSIRVHVVVACKQYFGPLLSHDIPERALELINRSAVSVDQRNQRPFDIVKFVRNRLSSFEERVVRFSKMAAAHGVALTTSRLTLLPDAAKPVRSNPSSRQAWEQLKCSPDHAQEAWCGTAFLSHIAASEPNGTLLVFISEASIQDDFPSVEVLRHFWQPSGFTTAAYAARMRNDELAVTKCFPLSTRFDAAVDRLMQRSHFSQRTVAWQLRAEKMSLAFHKRGVSWFIEFRRNILRQADLVAKGARHCGGGAILFESDLLGPGSATMSETIFTRHVKVGLDPIAMYGVPALNESTSQKLLSELRSSVMYRLRWGGMGRRGSKARPNYVLTAGNLLNLTSDDTDGALQPFTTFNAVPQSQPPLKLERALFSIAMLARARVLVRSPMSSTFSGWANAIRIATQGTSAAAWVTEDGMRWWRCERSSGIKLGKCKPEQAAVVVTSGGPQLCTSKRGTSKTTSLAAPGRRLSKDDAQCVHKPHTQEVFAPAVQATPSNASANWSLSSLVREHLRSFSTATTYSAVERHVPFETEMSEAQLAWEYEETLTFEMKQLKADPRLKPEDIQISFDHLKQCTECRVQEEVRKVVHGADPIHVFSSWQLMVDDHVIDSWRNVLRFLNPPKDQQVVVTPPSNASSSARFGCPCSVQRTAKGAHRLFHTAGSVTGPGHRYKEWPSAYTSIVSLDGRSRWLRPRRLVLDGYSSGVTGSFTIAKQQGQNTFVAGYEGANSKACLAHSTDGHFWRTVPTIPLMEQQPPPSITPQPRSSATSSDGKAQRPLHLTRSKIKVNLRKRPFKDLCWMEIQRCLRAGAMWGGGLVMACVREFALQGNLTASCSRALEPKLRPLLSDCVDGTRSALGRAGDCNVQPVFDARRQSQFVWYRQDFGTPGGWREIRGVQVVQLNTSLDHFSRPQSIVLPVRRVGSYYFDRLGKLERYRRQIYSITLTQHSDGLWLGLMTVIEWAKDMSEHTGEALPAFQRDTTNIYLVTSRDGVHVDTGWVYARQPLIPKAARQGGWNSGFVLAANEIVSDVDSGESRVYYEARQLRHEERFLQAGVIGMASWRLDTLVGLRVADASAGPAVVVTKPFRAISEVFSVLLNVETTTSCGTGRVQVELLDEASQPVPGASGDAAVPLVDSVGTAVEVQWNRPPPQKQVRVARDAVLRLRFTLSGSARLYAFRLLAHPAS